MVEKAFQVGKQPWQKGGALCLAGPQKAIKSMHVTAKLNRTKCSSQLLGTKALSWRQDHNQFPKFSQLKGTMTKTLNPQFSGVRVMGGCLYARNSSHAHTMTDQTRERLGPKPNQTQQDWKNENKSCGDVASNQVNQICKDPEK